jgi:hypothetical protein
VASAAMHPLVKLYITFVGLAAIMLLGHDLSVLALWPHPWSLGVTIALIVLTAIGDQLQFELRRGWYTTASAAGARHWRGRASEPVASHRIVAHLPTRLPTVCADIDRLGQVMNNLLSNAAGRPSGCACRRTRP